jgi:hypothetical protein
VEKNEGTTRLEKEIVPLRVPARVAVPLHDGVPPHAAGSLSPSAPSCCDNITEDCEILDGTGPALARVKTD